MDPHHILIEDPDGSCTLILDNLTGVDSGQYMCFAASAAGNASTLGKILVQGEPEAWGHLTSPPRALAEGMGLVRARRAAGRQRGGCPVWSGAR